MILKRGMIHKKKIKYFNPTANPIVLNIESETPIIKVIDPIIQIPPNGNDSYAS